MTTPTADGNGSITGGYVYRGNAIPALRGRYVYGDFQSGRIWALQDDGAGGYQSDELVDTAAGISSFGTGNDGELYFSDYSTGRLYRLRVRALHSATWCRTTSPPPAA